MEKDEARRILKIKEWNVSGSGRKPLVMMGARQVGKTWLLTAFADECYSGETVFVDLHDDEPPKMLIDGHALFTHFKGALTEQYVLEELTATGLTPYYWATNEGMAEVEFVVQTAEGVYPVEVKAERNLQSKSLKSYRERFAPSRCLRTSLAEHAVGKYTDDIPLYAIGSAIRDY